ncbi:hypothetical protein [Bordetella bronchiseptica]|uniref:AbiTii domain-containing protein n=1 Tax=Bordetella bronchiseptica TaxID=518 RepID=UPI00070F409C|nr:hypothetical protein [Bordetella bronchiseptica]AZW29151.1 hypothetical protein CS343_02440 [Bordetella bronchiseptica]
MTEKSRSQHILELARELLDDIELGRAEGERLILKASRLARWVGGDEFRDWLKYEMGGYNSSEPLSLKYMARTGRWTNREEKKGWWGPLAQQEAAILAQQAKLATMRTPDIGGDYANVAIMNTHKAMNDAALLIQQLSGIRSRVLAILHGFVSEVYYAKEFDSLTDSIFERYQRDVDALIVQYCGDVLTKIPALMDRLASGDSEAISQALSTCRRIIESFADSIFPPSEQIFEIGGDILKLDASKHQNRINVYVYQRTDSQSRRKRIRQNLSNLFDRVSSGVHKDISSEEARALFLNTYLFLGEILHLDNAATSRS